MSDQRLPESVSPYLGLIPYSETDASFFFGRERDTRIVVANLQASALTVLYGSSGVGKSSILRAGVIRSLREKEGVVILSFSAWQQPPVNALKRAVADACQRIDPNISLPSEEAELADYLAACADRINRRLLIILDQFDEYFLYQSRDDVFVKEFPRAVLHPDASVNFIVSIREDTLAKLDLFANRLPLLFDNLLRIEHLDFRAAQTAIQGPIRQYNELHPDLNPPVTIEDELVDRVLSQLKTGEVLLGDVGRGSTGKSTEHARIETPFLQLVMTRLWEEETESNSRTLRLETLNRLGGAESIVRTHLDSVMNTLDGYEHDVAARMFNHLVTPSGTKIAHTLPDLATYADVEEKELERVVRRLSDGRIRILRIVFPSPDQPGNPRYEIFHDVLAPAILDWRARYVQSKQSGRAAQYARVETQKRFARILRRLVAVFVFILLLTVLAALFAASQYRRARASERAAIESRRRAEDAMNIAAQQRAVALDALDKAASALREADLKIKAEAERNKRKAGR